MKKKDLLPVGIFLLFSIFIMTACDSHKLERDYTNVPIEQINQIDTLLQRAEDSLKTNNLKATNRAIVKGYKVAKDSDGYYMFGIIKGNIYLYTANVDSFMIMNHRVMRYLSRVSGNPSDYNTVQKNIYCKAMLQMSFYYSKMASNSDSALLYLKRAKKGIEYSKKSYALDNRLLLYNNFADVYKSTGRYDLCVKSLKDGLKLADSTKNNQETYMMFYMGIAAAYTSMRNFQQSNYWWNKTAGMMTCMANPDKFNFFNNRGSDLYYAGRYKESLKYLLCIDSLCDATKNMEFEKMFAHVNIADVYIKMNKICIAKKYIAETNSFFSKNKQTMVCDYINTQKININLLDGNIAEAYRIASLYPLHSNEGTDIKMQRYRALSDLYKKTKNYKLYIKNNEQYHHINDSLMDINVKMRCSEMLMSYNHDKKLLNQQILLEQKDTSLNISLIFLVVCVICIVLLGLIVGLILKQRKLRECQFRQRIVELRMENVRNRITPHFIYNALNHECLAQDEGRKIQLNNLVSLLRKGAQMVNNFCTTLEEELKFIDYYIGIESESIGSDFIYNIKVNLLAELI